MVVSPCHRVHRTTVTTRDGDRSQVVGCPITAVIPSPPTQRPTADCAEEHQIRALVEFALHRRNAHHLGLTHCS